MDITDRVRGYSKKKKILFVVGVCVVLAIVAAILVFKGEESYAEVPVQHRDMTTYYNFSGNIEANNSQTVLATSSQPVKKFYVEEGDYVEAGQLLVEFQNDSLQASLTQAQANVSVAEINYEKTTSTSKTEKTLQIENALVTAQNNLNAAEINLNRIKLLHENGANSQSELEEAQRNYDSMYLAYITAQNNADQLTTILNQDIKTAEAQLNQAKASLANVERQLADTIIYANISGTVSEISVNEGEQVATGTQIMSIIDYDDLEIKIKVDEYGLTAVSKGNEVQVMLNALNMMVGGTITRISESATVENGVSYFVATITLEPDEALRVGMSAEIKVINQQADNVLAVPMSAVQSDESRRAYVLIKNPAGKPQTQYVTLGINDGMMVEIKEGLEEDHIVLVSSSEIDTAIFNNSGASGRSSGPTVVRMGPGGGPNFRM